jgi:LmbE family N-acetylglucosaminyl deacetylase
MTEAKKTTKKKPATTKKTKAKNQQAKTSPKPKSVKIKQPVVKNEVAEQALVTAKPQKRISWGHYYVMFSLTILTTTTFIWSFLGAKLQQGNADQLVNSYLMGSWSTFQHATFPSTHSFLLKWPLFALIHWLGAGQLAIQAVTIAVCLATVGSLALLLHEINSRSWVFGTLILALASMLMLVPPVPGSGELLPVNMAMIATRNLEYIVYIISLLLLIKRPQFRARSFWLGALVLGLLIVTDRLFMTITLGGATMALVVYLVARNRQLIKLTVRWLGLGLVGLVIAISCIWAIKVTGITHLSSDTSSPYHLTHSPKGLGLGGLYAALDTITNFGANPAFDGAVIKQIPQVANSRLLSVAGPAFVINIMLMLVGLYCSLRLMLASIFRKLQKELDRPTQLSLLLLWSALAAVAAFAATDHYFAGDARYLTLVFFAVLVSTATWLRRWKPTSKKIPLVIGGVLVLGMGVGLISVGRTYQDNQAGLDTNNQRNILVATTLKEHPVTTLIGDYWRVVPIASASNGTTKVTPLSTCTNNLQILSSANWQPDLHNNSFAYLLTLDQNSASFSKCTLDEIINFYGRPNASSLIAGTLTNPNELLLFYDHGINKSVRLTNTPTTSTVLPISLNQLPFHSCPSDVTIMSIVAHQDDDLLFQNPDLIKDIQAKHCVRSIYLTAGDAGNSQLYWLSRERASEAAYTKMTGDNSIWIQHTVKLGDHQFATVANPRANAYITLIFMHLPDGNVNGNGFRANHFESLARLENGKTNQLHSIDGQSVFSASQVTEALGQIIETYQPTQIRTQATYNASSIFPDHSDHIATGRLARQAYLQYADPSQTSIEYYIGYPVRALPVNLSSKEVNEKTAAFLAYAKFDGAVCDTVIRCNKTTTYDAYLHRQYRTLKTN